MHPSGDSPRDSGNALAASTALNVGFVVLQTIFGFLVGSLALLSDAAHNAGDVLGLLLAWGAVGLARRQPSARRTYGFRRSTILAALANTSLLLAGAVVLIWHSISRLGDPPAIAGGTVAWVAAIGVLVNGVSALLLLPGGRRDVNLRAAFLHLVVDAATSLVVLVTGLLIVLTGWAWLDPVTSLFVAAVIAWSSLGLFRESLDLALDAVPAGIEPEQVLDYLSSQPGVVAVHDLHIWGMSATEPSLTAHLVMPERPADDEQLRTICRGLHRRFGIGHSTIQVERSRDPSPCQQARDEVV